MVQIALLFPDGSLNVHAPGEAMFEDRLKCACQEAASANEDVERISDFTKVVLVDVRLLETLEVPLKANYG